LTNTTYPVFTSRKKNGFRIRFTAQRAEKVIATSDGDATTATQSALARGTCPQGLVARGIGGATRNYL
jgi:hypothetical protein